MSEFKDRITDYFLDHDYKGKLISYCQQVALGKFLLRWTTSLFIHDARNMLSNHKTILEKYETFNKKCESSKKVSQFIT